MREKPESVDFPNAASQGAKIGSISQPSPTGNPATIGCVYSCTGAFSFALYEPPQLRGEGGRRFQKQAYGSRALPLVKIGCCQYPVLSISKGIDDLQTFELEVANIARDDRHAVRECSRG